jgi:hypothetical protein
MTVFVSHPAHGIRDKQIALPKQAVEKRIITVSFQM